MAIPQHFEPADAHFETRVRESFAKQRIMQTIGASLSVVQPGAVEIQLPFREDLAQQHGFVHAGAVATICDSACGYAAYTLMPSDAAVLSIEYKVNIVAPAQGERLIARGRVVRPGRTITTCAGDVFALRDGSEHLVATMLATMMTVSDRGLSG